MVTSNRSSIIISMEDSPEQVVRGKITCTFGDITFNSKFDSGNLDKIEEVRSDSPGTLCFNLWTAPDCAGTQYENGNRSWFYFSVTCQPSSESSRSWHTIRMCIMNLNKQLRLYQQGLTPLVKTFPGKGTWERTRDRPVCEIGDNGMTLTFDYYPSDSKHRTLAYFAFCFPYSYTECQKYLSKIDKRILTPSQPGHTPEDSIYYNRQLLCYSLDGLRIDLLTISSHHGITTETEPRLPGLYPDSSLDLPKIFRDKQVVFITSRVHPGETPSSYVFNGFLELILNPDDPRARVLRQHFVFKMVPMLNPDGVQRGHYRTDSRGINLNRMYIDPKWTLHPSVFCIRSLIMYYHVGVVVHRHGDGSEHDSDPPTCNCAHLHGSIDKDNIDCFDPPKEKGRVAVYVDLHAHATKRGCFMYGNHFASVEDHSECMVFPKLVSLNSVHFDFSHCVFTERNMCGVDKRDGTIGKEGSGRVAIYKATGLLQSYTLECNYNSGARMNGLRLATMDGGRATPPSTPSPIPYKYIASHYVEVGHGLALAILDLHQLNPWSRLPNSEYSTLCGLRQAMQRIVQECRDKTNKPRRVFTKQWNANKRNEVIVKEETVSNSEVFVQQGSTRNDENSQLASTIMLGGIQQACSLEHKGYRFHGESYKKLPRRHTSPSILIRPQSQCKFTYNTLYPCLTGNATTRLQHGYHDVSSSVRLPSVTMARPMSKTMFHAIKNHKSDIISNGDNPPIRMFTKFAVIGHQLLCPDSNPSLENVSSNEKAPLGYVNRMKMEQKNGIRIMKSPSASNKQKKSKPTLLSRSRPRRRSSVIASPSHNRCPPIVQLTSVIRKK